MNDQDAVAVSTLLLAAASAVVAGIQAGVAARGFEDVRPAHGFAFARLAPHGATVTELAAHLGVTRQAAGQLVDELVGKGYVARQPHPGDARARLVVLTEKGWDCARAADAAAAETLRPWLASLGERRARQLREDLARFTPPDQLRPAW